MELTDVPPGNDCFAKGLAVEAPHHVRALEKFGVDACDEFTVGSPSATDHRVHQVALWRAHRREVDLHAEAAFLGMENERTDIATDVKHQGFWGPLERSRVNVGLLWGCMNVVMRVLMLIDKAALMLLQGHGVRLAI
jgi:hypothetical protein